MVLVANVGNPDTVTTLQKRVNQLLTLTVNSPLFNAAKLIANGNSVIVNSNVVTKNRVTMQGVLTANGVSRFRKPTFVNSTLEANGATFIASANVTWSGQKNIINRVILSGNAEGNHFVSTANVIVKGATTIVKNLTSNGNAFLSTSNATFNGSNTNVLGKSLFIKANTTYQSQNTNVRGRSLLVTANTAIAGSLKVLGSIAGVSLTELDDVSKTSIANGSVLVYFTANSTWAPGIIDGGTY